MKEVSLTNESKILYIKIYKTVTQSTNKLKSVLWLVIGRLTLLKCQYYPKWPIKSCKLYQNLNGVFQKEKEKHFLKNLYIILREFQAAIIILKKSKIKGLILKFET